MNYQLRLLNADGSLRASQRSTHAQAGVWVFPIGFQNVSFDRAARVMTMDTPQTTLVDTGGVSTPRWRLEGTFGNKPKTLAGRVWTATDLVLDLQALLLEYATTRSEQRAQNRPLCELAVDDFLTRRHWVVVPEQSASDRANAREPTRTTFTLGLIGVREVSAPNVPEDSVSTALAPESRAALAATVRRMA